MKKTLTILTCCLLLLAANEGCKKSEFDINQNPNQPTDSTVTYNVILPAAQAATGRIITRPWGFLQNWLGYWARSGTYAPAAQEESYLITTSFGTGIWSGLYDNLFDYQTMQAGAKRAGAKYYEGIARLMKAHNFALLVDVYNNVPYTQALNGSANTTPKYDKGADIYHDLLLQIDSGASLIKSATVNSTSPDKDIATQDVMFAGDKTRWARYANTLKLRLLVHLMNGGVQRISDSVLKSNFVPGFDIAGEIAKINANGAGYLVADALINPGYTTNKPNPFYNLYVKDAAGTATANSVYYRGNSYAVGDDKKDGYYAYNGDPRIGKFYGAAGSGFRGVDYGLPSISTNASATLSAVLPSFYSTADKPVILISAAESFMLQSEAKYRGFAITGTAKDLLASGVQASFMTLGLSAAQATSYIKGNGTYGDVDITADGTTSAAGIKGGIVTIISQKWFALNALAPYEVWSDYRRVDFSPTIKHFVYGVVSDFRPGPPISVYQFNTATEIPVRLLYPQTEYNYNPVNVNEQGSITAYTPKIFWDLN